MNRDQKILLGVNLAGGAAVLGSYAAGLLVHPESSRQLWGSTPVGLIPVFIASMFLAAVGYLILTSYLIFCLDPGNAVINIRKGFRGFHVLTMLVLLPSICWMPLTICMLQNPSSGLWIAIRFVLLLVGIGGLGMLSALLSIQPRGKWWTIAFVGCIFFCIQVVLLDAFVWPTYFTLP